MKPRFFRALLTPLSLLLLGLTLSCSESEAPKDEFRIGFVAAIASTDARHTPDAARLAMEQVDSAGGLKVAGRRLFVRLLPRDNQDRLEDTLVAVRELISRDRVTAIVGPYVSRQAIPAAVLAQNAGVLLISPTSTNPETTRGKSLVFRACFVDTTQGRVLARFAHDDLGVTRAAVLYDAADDYCRGVAEYFRDAFTALGGVVPAFEAYLTGEKDFASRLARIKAAGCQVLLLPNFQPTLREQIRLAGEMGVSRTLLGTDTWHQPDVMALAESQGAYFCTGFAPDRNTPETREFVRAYRERYGKDPILSDAMGYDAMQLLFQAARNAGGTQPQMLAAGLSAIENYQGVTGTIRFHGSGDPVRSVLIMRVQGGRAVFHREIPPHE
ncbi:ABC transporter substrate-binding protein [Desulfovibrio aminophilus]|uniref:ABC transporter substrate-binding protein n=1 Tax=Desulfovibrio aminophilus TaxID=81425 RepID=UPI00339790EA